MAIVVSYRAAHRRALTAAKAVVTIVGLVTLSYLTVTSIEQSLALRDAGSAAAPASSELAGAPIACASFPDMTCPSREGGRSTEAADPPAPTF